MQREMGCRAILQKPSQGSPKENGALQKVIKYQEWRVEMKLGKEIPGCGPALVEELRRNLERVDQWFRACIKCREEILASSPLCEKLRLFAGGLPLTPAFEFPDLVEKNRLDREEPILWAIRRNRKRKEKKKKNPPPPSPRWPFLYLRIVLPTMGQQD